MGGGLAFDVNVDSARDNKQRADQHNEVKVLKADVPHALPRVQNKNVIEESLAKTNLDVFLLFYF